MLRRSPPGKLLPGAHRVGVAKYKPHPYVIYVVVFKVDREFRVISALYKVRFPVPKPLVLCKDQSVIRTQFYVMDHVKVASINHTH